MRLVCGLADFLELENLAVLLDDINVLKGLEIRYEKLELLILVLVNKLYYWYGVVCLEPKARGTGVYEYDILELSILVLYAPQVLYVQIS